MSNIENNQEFDASNSLPMGREQKFSFLTRARDFHQRANYARQVISDEMNRYIAGVNDRLPAFPYRKLKIVAKRNFGPFAFRRKSFSIKDWREKMRERKIEHRFFKKTNSYIPVSKLTITSPNIAHALSYKTLPERVIKKAISVLPEDLRLFHFIDVGAGRGRTVMLVSHFNFERITGVEFSKELYEDACLNRAQYPRPEMKCREIELKHQDFLDYQIPTQKQIFFIYRSFDQEMYARAIAHIKASYLAHPRRIYLIVVDPPRNGSLPGIINESGVFEPLKKFAGLRLSQNISKRYPIQIYRSIFRN